MTDIFEFNIKEIETIIGDYEYILDIKNKRALIKYSGILTAIKDILGDIVEMVYYVIPFQQIYYFNFKDVSFNKLIINPTSKFLCHNIIVKLTNDNFIKIDGLLELIHINNYMI